MAKKKKAKSLSTQNTTDKIDLMGLFRSCGLGGRVSGNEMEGFMKRLVAKGSPTQILQFKNEILSRHYPEYVPVFENLYRITRPELVNRDNLSYNIPTNSLIPRGRIVYRNIRAAEFSYREGRLYFKKFTMVLTENTSLFKPEILARVHNRFNVICKDDKFHFMPASDLHYLITCLKETVEIQNIPRAKPKDLPIPFLQHSPPTFYGTLNGQPTKPSKINTQPAFSDGVDYSLRKYKSTSYSEGSKTIPNANRYGRKKGK